MKYKLEDVCNQIYSGGTPSTSHKEYWGGDLPWLSSGETSQRFVYTTEKTITEEGVKKSSTKYAKRNSTVMASAGQGHTRGQVSYLMNDMYVNQSVLVFDPNERFIEPLYLYYNLDGRYGELRQLSDGTSTRGSLSGRIVKGMDIEVPDLAIQKKIIDILYNLDRKIEINEAINRNLEVQQELLWKNVFENVEQDIELGSVINTTSGGTPSRKKEGYYEEGQIHWIKSKELNGSFICETEEKITDIALEKSSAKILPAYTVLIAMYGATVGEYGIISDNMTCNQAVCALLQNADYPCSYLFSLAKHSKGKLINMAIGSAQQNISQVLIKKLLVHSNKDKIREYCNTADTFLKQVEINVKENMRLNNLRDILLPRLMSGELVTSDLDVNRNFQ